MTPDELQKLTEMSMRMAQSQTAENPLPPYATDTEPQVRDLAKGLEGLAFGHLDQPQRFQSHPEFYAPLAQAILNRLHGWVIDPESKQWKRMEE